MKYHLRAMFFVAVVIGYLSFGLVSSVVRTNNLVETCQTDKELKSLLKTTPNILVLFAKNDLSAKEPLVILKDVSVEVKGSATVAFVNCEKAKKLCKKYKVTPDTYELKHYSEGVFNKDYDRQMNKKSIVNFLNDPKSDMPWEEEDNAKDVVHLKDGNELSKLLKKATGGVLVMFYAPWCGYCKKLKPDYSSAATDLKSSNSILAALDMDKSGNYQLKEMLNITGYPTLLYFENGNLLHPYGGEYNRRSLVQWMKNPAPPKEKEPEPSWADEKDVHVTFLTDATFDTFIESHDNCLVMFYAPWCGHCKTMKPVLNRVAKKLTDEKSKNVIAFVDATKEQELATRFKLTGFPTVKLFKDGQFAFDYNERSESKILDFMRNPVEQPPEPEKEPSWSDEISQVVHAESSNLPSLLKTKKHALAFFYAPWCGHCKTAKPHFTRAAEHFKDEAKIAFIAVDCTLNQEVCDAHKVNGFPTIIYFSFGKHPTIYNDVRDTAGFIRYIDNKIAVTNVKKQASEKKSEKPAKKEVEKAAEKSSETKEDKKATGKKEEKNEKKVEEKVEKTTQAPVDKVVEKEAKKEEKKATSDKKVEASEKKEEKKVEKTTKAPVDKVTEKEKKQTTTTTTTPKPTEKKVEPVAAKEKVPETVKSSEKKAEKEAKQDADKKADKKSDKSKETEKSEKKKESDKKAEKKVEEKVDKVETSTTKKSAEKPTKKEKEQAKPAKSTTDASESKKTKSKDQPKDKQATKDVWEGVSGRQHVHFLNDATFEEFVNTKRKVLVLFYNSKAASKKGQQQELYEAYGKAATEVTSFVPGSYLAAVDTVNSKKLAASFKAQAYPALKYFENADYKFDYKYKSTKEDFVDFMREPNVEKYRKSEL